MEEDLAELKIIIKTMKDVLQEEIKDTTEDVYTIDGRQFKALENLLTRYKEIKTEHKIMKRILVEHNLWETLLNDDEFIKHLEEE